MIMWAYFENKVLNYCFVSDQIKLLKMSCNTYIFVDTYRSSVYIYLLLVNFKTYKYVLLIVRFFLNYFEFLQSLNTNKLARLFTIILSARDASNAGISINSLCICQKLLFPKLSAKNFFLYYTRHLLNAVSKYYITTSIQRSFNTLLWLVGKILLFFILYRTTSFKRSFTTCEIISFSNLFFFFLQYNKIVNKKIIYHLCYIGRHLLNAVSRFWCSFVI